MILHHQYPFKTGSRIMLDIFVCDLADEDNKLSLFQHVNLLTTNMGKSNRWSLCAYDSHSINVPSFRASFSIQKPRAFAMYCFGRYLVACLGGEERTIEFMEREGRASSKTPLLEHGSEKGTVKHPFPMNYFFKPWRLGRWLYQVIKIGIVQYMIIKSLSAVIAVILEAFGVYCEGEFDLTCGYIYMAMGIASVVHLYVYPAKPYELMGDRMAGSISVLGDYASVDCPLDPEEVRDSERPTKLRLPQLDIGVKSGTAIRESVRDIVIGGGGYLVKDVKFTVTQAVEPMEKGFTRFNQKLQNISQNIKRYDKDKRRTKDDSCIATSTPTQRIIRGIDDPLLNGSFSDSGVSGVKKHHRRKSGYTSAESGGESGSDQSYGSYQIRGRRWVTKD
ncbi:Organic solute transporter subunit alpha/Transmembrane protein 184 [Dillenia turbinata]|uniref:Organic solute transporter subunit alpha/Transmembrane protein 184 n=1 Tax=Dillenia turbinata TaxID=194707 RepID=A0AAN8UJQ9_9MAGN